MSTHTPQELFARWVETPVATLRKVPYGDGAFAALAISLGLYERYIKSVLHKAQMKGTPENFRKEVSRDLSITEDVADRFWNGYRLGLMHAFQPKNYVQDAGQGDAWGWAIAEGVGFDAFPVVEKKAEKLFVIRLDPWKFTEHVLAWWRANPALMNELTDFAFGRIEQIDQPKPAPPDSTFSYRPPESFRTYSQPPRIIVPETGRDPRVK